MDALLHRLPEDLVQRAASFVSKAAYKRIAMAIRLQAWWRARFYRRLYVLLLSLRFNPGQLRNPRLMPTISLNNLLLLKRLRPGLRLDWVQVIP